MKAPVFFLPCFISIFISSLDYRQLKNIESIHSMPGHCRARFVMMDNFFNFDYVSYSVDSPEQDSLKLSDILHFNEVQLNPDFELDSTTLSENNNTEWINVDTELDKYLSESANSDSSWELPERTILCNELCEKYLEDSSIEPIYIIKYPPLNEQHEYIQQANYKLENAEEKSSRCDESVFPCPFYGCSKFYNKASHLKAHTRRHTGEKPFLCTWPNCSWKFSRSDELARHNRSHSGVKPYKCMDCDKTFSRSDHLMKHKKVHVKRIQNRQPRIKILHNSNIYM